MPRVGGNPHHAIERIWLKLRLPGLNAPVRPVRAPDAGQPGVLGCMVLEQSGVGDVDQHSFAAVLCADSRERFGLVIDLLRFRRWAGPGGGDGQNMIWRGNSLTEFVVNGLDSSNHRRLLADRHPDPFLTARRLDQGKEHDVLDDLRNVAKAGRWPRMAWTPSRNLSRTRMWPSAYMKLMPPSVSYTVTTVTLSLAKASVMRSAWSLTFATSFGSRFDFRSQFPPKPEDERVRVSGSGPGHGREWVPMARILLRRVRPGL